MRSKIESSIEEATTNFKRGDVVIFPTDTIYGIGCITGNETSIKRLYSIRKTPLSKPSLILVSSIKMAKKYGQISEVTESILTKLWPGPLTTIVKAVKEETNLIQGNTDCIAIRVPDFPFILSIIERLGKPIIAPSANFPGKKAPTSFAEIDKRMISLVDYSIDPKDLGKNLKITGIESTIIDLSKKPFKLVRKGTISRLQLKSYFPDLTEGGSNQ
jgi:L-threonylcarbamoyladenylate synthase